MKYADISQLGVSELTNKKESLVAELFQAKMKNTTGQLGNPVQIRYLRKDLARVETALSVKVASGEMTVVESKVVESKVAEFKKNVVAKTPKKAALKAAPAKKTAAKKSVKGTK